ncbi:hypothetical protein F511_35377 [Dorcoceras hygrometricum]|uniref:Uncharacterized protein n=1 Tax=Dorcoceras hygrometricum TaxID=472368 RepID=A0A2Z7B844_9LAMI|nr:hypothetical protein F511_35377 [Dorcoceras hygrometricum]
MPKNLVYDARSIFSKSGVTVSTHGKKRFMKYEYRLLNDILAKAITVKAGSFDAVTNERFLMMTAIQFGLKVNWSKILFGVLKEMVDKTQKKAKGYAAQICALLKRNPVITFGEAVPFPTSKVMSIKTVHTYISMNHTIDSRGQSDEPGMAPVAIVKRKSKSKKTSETTGETPVEVITEVVSKKRPTVESDEPVVLKKRRTTKSKASSSKASLDIVNVAQDVVPLQIVEPTPAATAEKSPLPKRKSKKRRLVLSKDSDDENVEEQESVKDTIAVAVEESTFVKHTDEVDVIIGQDTAVDKSDNFERWLDESYEDFGATETVDKAEGSKDIVGANAPEKAIDRNQTDEELMSIDDLLMQISDNMMLPSVTPTEVTKIRLGSSIEINEVQDNDWYYASLPRISIHDKGKEPLEEVDIVKEIQDLKEKEKLMLDWAEASSLETAVRRRVYILAKYREMLLRKFLDSHRKYYTPGQPWTATASQIIDLLSVAHSNSLEDLLAQQKEHGIIMDRPSSSQPFKDLADNSGDVQILHLNEFKKGVLAHGASVTADLMEVRKEVKELDAKVTYLDGKVASIRSELFDFQAKVAENYLNLSTQLGDLVDYIRGGDAKKGEGSSSRPQPPPDDQGGGSGGGNSGCRTTDIVDRFSGSMSREDQGRGRSGERRSSGNRSGHSNRRRYDSDERMDLGPSLIPRRSAKFWCTGKD